MDNYNQTSTQPTFHYHPHTLKRALSQSTTSSTSSTTTTPSSPNTHGSKTKPRKASRLSSVKDFLHSRSNSPTPSDCSSPVPTFDIPRSIPSNSDHRSTSPTAMSHRVSSDGDSHSASHKRSTSSAYARRSGDDYRRYSGTVNHYGRHSNDWLFGGFSLRDTVRGGVDRLRHHSKG
ncbi:hypothetical protein BO94DRAFT_36117 [Aspergillus sclerotioniger CBS 115572]|uniref:Uncharacterized protein n=1 Tax=Aspergillus sclerotioniger CBS 115572 TaxID=1450535 RepID=A0A317WSL2_9EURO|nr:hypothetical protein BO94DRAFT_36117 [Aspergillus sclerotioniger CBS 115572]PWY89444.1 hypothetical protein BO94DRAFT_36117 [Aspergillus sclerotioniger CBS 115572]